MSPSMVIHPLLRNTLLAGARKVHIPQVPTTGSNSNSSFVLYGNFIQGCSFSQPSGSKIIPTPLKFFNYHNHQLMHQTNLSSCTPMSKGSVQSLISHREFSLSICCKIIDSCRNARTRLISKVNNVLQRTPKSKVGFRKVRLDKIILGSMFLSPSQLFRNQKEEKMIIAELPKEPKKKTRGSLFQLLLSVYELLQLSLRALRLVLTFGPILALYPVTYLGKTATDAWWNLLLIAIEFSGPILIKLGQWASTRRDIFPDSCCSQFSRLQRRIEPHSWKYTLYQMKRAFGPQWRKVFIKFDNDCKPIGSGCVAQVYKVWMATDAIHDNEIMEEILLDLDDDTLNLHEGLEVMGFGDLFSSENLMKLEQARALQDWREQQKLKRHQEREQQQLLIQPSQAENEGQPLKVQTVEIPKDETDVLSIVENLASDVLNNEDQTAVDSRETAEPGANIMGEVEEDLLTHSLVEEWQEGTDSHDKSLPLDEAPPDDLEGLVPVAIKILHPGVESAFKRDLRIMRAFAWFITFVFPSVKWLSLPQCVDEFSEVMTAQINLKTEAENLETFSENFADISFIKFPRPLRPYVTKKVLVETYEDGEPMIDFIKHSEEDSNEELRKRLAEIGVDALLKMVFVDNLVHGDLHPGNMLVQNNSTGQEGGTTSAGDTVRIMMVDVGCDTFVMDVQPDPNPLRICILDCGVVSNLSQQNLNNIRAVFKQIVLGDGESVADLFLNNSEHQCKDPEAFKGEITDLVQTARENTISLGQVDVGMLLQQVLGILLRHHVRLESAFSAVVLAIFVLEGLGRMLDPNMDILERARPILVTGDMN